jgi:hypothetical protein
MKMQPFDRAGVVRTLNISISRRHHTKVFVWCVGPLLGPLGRMLCRYHRRTTPESFDSQHPIPLHVHPLFCFLLLLNIK